LNKSSLHFDNLSCDNDGFARFLERLSKYCILYDIASKNELFTVYFAVVNVKRLIELLMIGIFSDHMIPCHFRFYFIKKRRQVSKKICRQWGLFHQLAQQSTNYICFFFCFLIKSTFPESSSHYIVNYSKMGLFFVHWKAYSNITFDE